mmetsp:Transcript_63759/g.74679  ORF Transcript_63759/g.74679 Transcript_63759/m.74679 type:complete len:273 (-) Transcript_63759:2-820(-)
MVRATDILIFLYIFSSLVDGAKVCYLNYQPLVHVGFDINGTSKVYDNNMCDGIDEVDCQPARQCPCSFDRSLDESANDGKFYCLVKDGNMCREFKFSDRNTIGCFHTSTQIYFARQVWPVIILWYVGLIYALFNSTLGHQTRMYIVRKYICPRRNQIEAERTVAREIEIQARNRELVEAQLEEEISSRPTHLKLKTKRYICDDTIDPLETCIICLGDFENGCKVGVMPCKHVIHSSCLKEWLQKKNICPLCQMSNIATIVTSGEVSETISNS